MLLTIADLQKEISETELLQLSDINAGGVRDELIIDEAISDATAFISSFIVIPPDPTPYLVSIGVELTLYELRKLHHLQDEKVRERCEEKLLRMARGTVPTTLTQEAAPRRTGNTYRHGRTAMDLSGFNS